MILKAAGLGFLLWLIATAAFFFWGESFFVPERNGQLWLFVSAVPVCAGATWACLKVLGEHPSDRAEAAIALAFPGMFLDVIVTQNFQSIFPRIDPLLGQTFAALMLLSYGVMIFTGLMMTRITQEDERL